MTCGSRQAFATGCPSQRAVSQSESTSESGGDRSPFPPTRWTLVLEAGEISSPRSVEAVQQLCVMYRAPILAWLVRRGQNPAKAEDLTQGFMVHLLEKNRLQGFVRGEAKLRSFLLRCLQRFVRDPWRHETTTVPEPIEDHEPPVEAAQDRAFDRDLALTIHKRAIAALEECHVKSGRAERFQALRRHILGSDRGAPYAEMAQRLQMTVSAVKKAVFDLREDYCELFRAEVAETVARELVDEEMRYLLPLLVDTEATAPT